MIIWEDSTVVRASLQPTKKSCQPSMQIYKHSEARKNIYVIDFKNRLPTFRATGK